MDCGVASSIPRPWRPCTQNPTHDFPDIRPGPYNADVAYFSLDRRLTRLLLAVLFGLLALGPFLHAHLGFSKVTGFHVAGYDGPVNTSSDHEHEAQQLVQHPDLSDAESPAVGVSASLVRFNHDIPCPDGITLQVIVAIMATWLMPGTLAVFAPAASGRSTRPRPGLPPPALAPPL